MKPANAILSACSTTIFTVMSALARDCGAINLGQGFPDEDGPPEVLRVAADAIVAGPNQYPPMTGIEELRRAVAEHGERFYGLDYDPGREVVVTSGATEALAACAFGLIEPGDEVVLIEPLYDAYLPLVRRAGATPRLVRLRPPDWSLPIDDLRAAFSHKTKLLILNSPLNPAGKVFNGRELEIISELLAKHDAYAVCDEVYEHLVFDGGAHRPLATMPGMRDRAIRIGSAGKTFSVTGWKVGWACGAAPLIEAATKAHQFLTFTTPPALQSATASALRLDDGYFRELAAVQQAKRDRLASGLASAGFEVLPTMGSYFLTAGRQSFGFNGSDESFCRWLTTEAGVAAIPLSAFYAGDSPEGFVRFCFCKRDAVLDEAIARLKRAFDPREERLSGRRASRRGFRSDH